MCGIIGYFGEKNAAPLLLEGLKNLEYRGYDSCGIAILDNNKIHLKKDIGKVEEVDKKINFANLSGNIGIAHTRWATHGKVTKENAHPHLSNNKQIAVVHNGIIENYKELKDFLVKEGFFFESDTDTEIIPNLIEYYVNQGNSFIESAKISFKELEGQFAIVAFNNEGKMVGIRKEAPLVIAIGENEYFIASDVIAFLEHTKKVVFLEERDMVIIQDLKTEIFNLDTNLLIERKFSKIEWDYTQAKKGEYDHFFMKEVIEQAEVIKNLSKIEKSIIKNITNEIKKAKETYIIACGSAFYAGLCGVYLFSKIANKKINFSLASEFDNLKNLINDEDLIIAISQSGETADTLSAIRLAKSAGAKIVCISNVNDSTLIRESSKSILQNAGPEICVLSTKSYTSQIAILTLLAYELNDNLDEGIEKLREIPRLIYYLTSDNARDFLKELSTILKNKENIFVIGRGAQYPTALEAALKIKESSYIHSEAFAGGELKHGSIALISEGTPCIVLFSEGNERETLNNVMEVKSRGAYVIGIGPKNNEAFDFFIKVVEAGNFNSILQIIPVQILSYQLALLRGCNPDKPRNLAKSVVVK